LDIFRRKEVFKGFVLKFFGEERNQEGNFFEHGVFFWVFGEDGGKEFYPFPPWVKRGDLESPREKKFRQGEYA
jgi:hypothetical protein